MNESQEALRQLKETPRARALMDIPDLSQDGEDQHEDEISKRRGKGEGGQRQRQRDEMKIWQKNLTQRKRRRIRTMNRRRKLRLALMKSLRTSRKTSIRNLMTQT